MKVGSHNGGQGPQSSSGMGDIVSGGLVAGLISLCANGFKVLGDSMSFWLPVGSKGITQIPLGFSTALLGAGYLIGIASGIAILVGVLIAWAGFVPYFTNMFAPDGGATAKFAMGIWKSKVRFIGAGAIGIAAIWTLITLIKPIIEGMKISVKSMNSSAAERETHRMDTDMSTKICIDRICHHPYWFGYYVLGFRIRCTYQCRLDVDTCCSRRCSSFINRLLRSCSMWLHGRSYRYICISNLWYWYLGDYYFFLSGVLHRF